MKKKRTWIIIGIIAVLIAGGAYLVVRQTNGQAGASTSVCVSMMMLTFAVMSMRSAASVASRLTRTA